jgi:hypothetical protein
MRAGAESDHAGLCQERARGQQAAGQKSLRVRKGGGDDAPHAPWCSHMHPETGGGGGENEMGQETRDE